jgi:hypothetical protein
LEGLGALIRLDRRAGTFDGVFVTGIVAVLSADRSIGDQPKPKYRAPKLPRRRAILRCTAATLSQHPSHRARQVAIGEASVFCD